MVKVEIRTNDDAWAAAHGTPGRDGRTVIDVATVEPLDFAGVLMVRFDIGADQPNDSGNRWHQVPAAWIVG